MDQWALIFVVFGVVVLAMMGTAWTQMLEHSRRKQAMEVIKAALEAGREPPAQLYEAMGDGQPKPPWAEVVVFTSLSFGFWLAYFQATGGERVAFLVIAATMTVTGLGCLGLALMRPGRSRDDKR